MTAPGPATRKLVSTQRRKETVEVQTYVILRRSGWRSSEELQAAAVRSSSIANDEMADQIRWLRSYVLAENGGRLGTVCIYQAAGPEKIREHAVRADLPVDEIIEVADTVIVRADPEPVGAR